MSTRSPILLRGMTWADPRGTGPLAGLNEAFATKAAGQGIRIDWDVQPLAGFESHPLSELALRYDLLIVDHPHCGEAARTGCLRPVAEVPDNYVGLSRASYLLEGKYWAYPFDAASQIAAYHPTRLPAPPRTWEEVWALPGRGVRVAVPLTGVHALMALGGLLASLGQPLDEQHGWPERDVLAEAARLLRRLAGICSSDRLRWNPIDAFRAMVAGQVDYIPLTFGYEHFSSGGVRFTNLPSHDLSRPAQAILGGTGLAISAHSRHPAAAEAFAQFATASFAQTALVPERGGQPAHRDAWNALAGTRAFYRDARDQVESACLRPRCAGWPRFQLQAGNAINQWLCEPSRSVQLLQEAVSPLWDALVAHTRQGATTP